jgi:rare lipoprotein A
MARIASRKLVYCSPANVRLAIFGMFVFLLHGCAGHTGYKPHPEVAVYKETGIASYYARKFQHRKTASGERFDNNSMTAAHKTLPFGTEVIVKNINNGKSVKVRINDRGPFVEGRIIDLTRVAFSKIANLDAGLATVEITAAR